jgi:phospholipase C
MAFGTVAAMLLAAALSAGAESDNGTHSPIKHTIILYQENISFAHYFGTYGHGVNGISAGATLSHFVFGQDL